MKDPVMLGTALGLLADGIKLLANYIAFRLGYISSVFWKIVASRFLMQPELDSPAAYIAGAAADLTTAALLGVIYVYMLRFTTRHYPWLKGIGLGLLTWTTLFGSLLGQTGMTLNAAGIVVTLVAHSLFGLSLALFHTWLNPEHQKTRG